MPTALSILFDNQTTSSIVTADCFHEWFSKVLSSQAVAEQLPQRPTSHDIEQAPLFDSENFLGDMTIGIIITNKNHMQNLNAQYRQKDKPTNILSFPGLFSPQKGLTQLGDIVICETVIGNEAIEQNKPLLHHWTHISIHGLLHLLGFDHETTQDAEIMENLEINLLAQLGIENPYQTTT